MADTGRDPYVPKGYNCAETARFDLGKPVGTLAGSPMRAIQQPTGAYQAPPSHYYSLDQPAVLEVNISPVQRTLQLAREEQERYMYQIQADEHYQQQNNQTNFLANSVNRRPTQPVSLDEAKAFVEKKAKQSAYFQELQQTSSQQPIEAQRVSLLQINAQKQRPPPDSRGVTHLHLGSGQVPHNTPAITVQNVLTGTGAASPTDASPEAKRRAQADYIKMIEDSKNLQPLTMQPYRRQSRPPSTGSVLGPTSSLSSIGLRDTAEYKKQQYDARRAIALASLQGSHQYRAAEGVGYTPVGTPVGQALGGSYPLRGAIDGYQEGCDVVGYDGHHNSNHQGAATSHQHDGDKKHSSAIAFETMQSVHDLRDNTRAPVRPTPNETPRPTHHPSPKVQAALKRMAEEPPVHLLSEEEIATVEAEKRRHQALQYNKQLQQDPSVPHPAAEIDRIPITALRAANRNNEINISHRHAYGSIHSGAAPSINDLVGDYENNTRLNKKATQEMISRQIAESANAPAIKPQRVSLIRKESNSNAMLPPDPFKNYGPAGPTYPHETAHPNAPISGMSNTLDPEKKHYEYGHTEQGESSALGSSWGYTGFAHSTEGYHLKTPSSVGHVALGLTQSPPLSVDSKRAQQEQRVAQYENDRAAQPIVRERKPLSSPRDKNITLNPYTYYPNPSPLQGPNYWENAAITNGLGGPTGPNNLGFLGGTANEPTSARNKTHATHQMHYNAKDSGYGESARYGADYYAGSERNEGIPVLRYGEVGSVGSMVDTFKNDKERMIMRGNQDRYTQQPIVGDVQVPVHALQSIPQLQYSPMLTSSRPPASSAANNAYSNTGIGALAMGQRPTPRSDPNNLFDGSKWVGGQGQLSYR